MSNISNTQEILRRLDEISTNQYELAQGLQNAHSCIGALCQNVSKHIKNTTAQLEQVEKCAEITAYQAAQANQRVEFMTWLQLFD